MQSAFQDNGSPDYSGSRDLPPNAAVGAAPAGIGISDVIGILRRGWAYIAIGSLVGLLLGIGFVLLAPSLYKSTARVLIDKSVTRYLQTNKILEEPVLDDSEVTSQIYILNSENVILKVIRQLDLMRDPEFVGKTPLKPVDQSSLTAQAKSLIKAMLGMTPNGAIDPDAVQERRAVEKFMQRLTVTRADTPSVIEVTFSSEDALKAAKIANALVDTYLEGSLSAKMTSTQMASRMLQDRLGELKGRMNEADELLHSYKLANGIVNDNKSTLSRDQLQILSNQLTTARVNIADTKARLERLKRQMDRDGTPGAAIPDNDVVKRLRMQYLDLIEREAELKPRVGEGHEAVKKLRTRMKELASALREEEKRQADSYENDYNLAVAREGEIMTALSKAATEVNSTNQSQIPLRELEQASEALHTLYNSVQQKYIEITKVQSETLPVQDARVVTRAAPPLGKNMKKSFLALVGGLAMGLLLGAGTTLATELYPAGFRSSDQIKQATGFYCVNIVAAEIPKKSAKKARYAVLAQVMNAPFSRFTEGFRQIKALALQSKRLNGDKVFCIASSVSGEGKTLVAGNLATLLKDSNGQRTLLIDCDLHRRSLTRQLIPDAEHGIVEALAEPSRFAEFVSVIPDTGVHVLPCVMPERSAHAADLLGSSEMGDLLKLTREAYDFVIIDAPPIMPVVDVRMFERFVDKFVFVVQWNATSRRVVEEALGESMVIQDRMLCIALNNIHREALSYIEAYKGPRANDYYEN